eukprot:GEMP01001297.1.p1 GENE.GEMP01001297.1~~GEMP01001297.1.p1  ORF type:complete len:1609 (+),score=306.59 GEMP01001297.1:167-4993(+)
MDMRDGTDEHKEHCSGIFSFKAMHSLRSVRELDLSSSRIKKIPFMLDLPLLEELHLDHNMLTTTSGLLLCTALRYINFANNKIRAVTMLEMQVNLEVLNLSDNAVGSPEKSVRTLSINPKLSTIRVKGNPCTNVPRYWVVFANIIGVQLIWVDNHRVRRERSSSCGRMRYGQQKATYAAGKYGAKVSLERPTSQQHSSRPQRKPVPRAAARTQVEQPKNGRAVLDRHAEMLHRRVGEPQRTKHETEPLTDASSRRYIKAGKNIPRRLNDPLLSEERQHASLPKTDHGPRQLVRELEYMRGDRCCMGPECVGCQWHSPPSAKRVPVTTKHWNTLKKYDPSVQQSVFVVSSTQSPVGPYQAKKLAHIETNEIGPDELVQFDCLAQIKQQVGTTDGGSNEAMESEDQAQIEQCTKHTRSLPKDSVRSSRAEGDRIRSAYPCISTAKTGRQTFFPEVKEQSRHSTPSLSPPRYSRVSLRQSDPQSQVPTPWETCVAHGNSNKHPNQTACELRDSASFPQTAYEERPALTPPTLKSLRAPAGATNTSGLPLSVTSAHRDAANCVKSPPSPQLTNPPATFSAYGHDLQTKTCATAPPAAISDRREDTRNHNAPCVSVSPPRSSAMPFSPVDPARGDLSAISPVAAQVSIVVGDVSVAVQGNLVGGRLSDEEPAQASSQSMTIKTHACAETQTSPLEERSARVFSTAEPAHVHRTGISRSAFAFAPSPRQVATPSLERPILADGSPRRHAVPLTRSGFSMTPEESRLKAAGTSALHATCPEPDVHSFVRAALADAVNPRITLGKSKSWDAGHFGWRRSFTSAQRKVRRKKTIRSAGHRAASHGSGPSLGSSASMLVSRKVDYGTSTHAFHESENATAARANGSLSPSRLPEGRSSSPAFYVHRPDTPQCHPVRLTTASAVDERQPYIEEVDLSSRATSRSPSVDEVETLQSGSPYRKMAVSPFTPLAPASREPSHSCMRENFLEHNLHAEKEHLPTPISPRSLCTAEILDAQSSSASPHREMMVSPLASAVTTPSVHLCDRMRSLRQRMSFSYAETPPLRAEAKNAKSSCEEVNTLWRDANRPSELANMETLMLSTSSCSGQEQRQRNTSPARHFGIAPQLSVSPKRNTSPACYFDPPSSFGVSSMRAYASQSASPVPRATHPHTNPARYHDVALISSIDSSRRVSQSPRAERNTNPFCHDVPSAVRLSASAKMAPPDAATVLHLPRRAHDSSSSTRSGDRGLYTENALLSRMYGCYESPSSYCSDPGGSYCSPTDTSPMQSVRDSYHCPSSDVSPVRAHARLYPSSSQHYRSTDGTPIVRAPNSFVRGPDASASYSPPTNIGGEYVPLSRGPTVDDASPVMTTITPKAGITPLAATQDAPTLSPLPSYEEIAVLLDSFRSALALSPPSAVSSSPVQYVPPHPQGTYPPRHCFDTSSPLRADNTLSGLDGISRSNSSYTGSEQSPSWHVTRVSPPSHRSTRPLAHSNNSVSGSMMSRKVVATLPRQCDSSLTAQSHDVLVPRASTTGPIIDLLPYFPIPDDLFPISRDDEHSRAAASDGTTPALACPYASLVGTSPSRRESYFDRPSVMVSPIVGAQYGYFHGGEVDMFGGTIIL